MDRRTRDFHSVATELAGVLQRTFTRPWSEANRQDLHAMGSIVADVSLRLKAAGPVFTELSGRLRSPKYHNGSRETNKPSLASACTKLARRSLLFERVASCIAVSDACGSHCARFAVIRTKAEEQRFRLLPYSSKDLLKSLQCLLLSMRESMWVFGIKLNSQCSPGR